MATGSAARPVGDVLLPARTQVLDVLQVLFLLEGHCKATYIHAYLLTSKFTALVARRIQGEMSFPHAREGRNPCMIGCTSRGMPPLR